MCFFSGLTIFQLVIVLQSKTLNNFHVTFYGFFSYTMEVILDFSCSFFLIGKTKKEKSDRKTQIIYTLTDSVNFDVDEIR